MGPYSVNVVVDRDGCVLVAEADGPRGYDWLSRILAVHAGLVEERGAGGVCAACGIALDRSQRCQIDGCPHRPPPAPA